MNTIIIKISFPSNLDVETKEEELKEILIKLTHSIDNYLIKDENCNLTYLNTESIVKIK